MSSGGNFRPSLRGVVSPLLRLQLLCRLVGVRFRTGEPGWVEIDVDLVESEADRGGDDGDTGDEGEDEDEDEDEDEVIDGRVMTVTCARELGRLTLVE